MPTLIARQVPFLVEGELVGEVWSETAVMLAKFNNVFSFSGYSTNLNALFVHKKTFYLGRLVL